MLLITNQIPELPSDPIRIFFHLLSEILTALTGIAAGIGLTKNEQIGRTSFC